MPDTAIAGLTPLAAANYAADDLLVIDDTSATATKSTRADNVIEGLLRASAGVLTYDGNAISSMDLKPNSNDSRDLGSGSSRWRNFYVSTIYVDTASGFMRIGDDVYLRRAAANVLSLSNGTVSGTLGGPMAAPAQITANQPAYAGLTGRYNLLTSDASRDIQGIAVGVDGEERFVINAGSQNIVLKNDSGSATAAGNKILTHTGADITLAAQGAARLVYDGTNSRWRTV